MNEKIVMISVAKDFTKFTGPRYAKLGDYSGEEFRDDLLIPAIEQNDHVVIDLDGTKGYGSSFLEEVFGGLIRKNISPEIVKAIELISKEDPSVLSEIDAYIAKAIANLNR